VGSDLVVVAGVGFEDATQIRFAEHQDVVEAFAPDRANEPLDLSVLPGRACRSWTIAYTHRMNAPGVRRPERTVAVTDQMTRRFAPGKGFGQLACDPFCGRIGGHGDPRQPPSGVVEDH